MLCNCKSNLWVHCCLILGDINLKIGCLVGLTHFNNLVGNVPSISYLILLIWVFITLLGNFVFSNSFVIVNNAESFSFNLFLIVNILIGNLFQNNVLSLMYWCPKHVLAFLWHRPTRREVVDIEHQLLLGPLPPNTAEG